MMIPGIPRLPSLVDRNLALLGEREVGIVVPERYVHLLDVLDVAGHLHWPGYASLLSMGMSQW